MPTDTGSKLRNIFLATTAALGVSLFAATPGAATPSDQTPAPRPFSTDSLRLPLDPRTVDLHEVYERCVKEQKSFILTLRRMGYDLKASDKNGYSPATMAVQKQDAQVLMALGLLKADLDAPDGNGVSPKIYAAFSIGGNMDVIHVLDHFTVDLSKPGRDEFTMGTAAASLGNLNVIGELGDMNVDLSVADKNGRTPATVTASTGDTTILYFLDIYKVDLSKPDGNGNTPVQIAEQKGDSATADFIKRTIAAHHAEQPVKPDEKPAPLPPGPR